MTRIFSTPWTTIHEGVTARALERQGIISDRCKMNRQIKADSRLLRELKSLVKKLTAAVKNTMPMLAEKLETLRGNMIVIRYQLRRIGVGKQKMSKYVGAVKPELERYASLVGQIKGKARERKNLLVEKRDTPALNVLRHRDLSRRIAELTEDLEELKSEKDVVLHALDCADDAAISVVKKDVSAMENSLKKLYTQEEKYAAELDDALREYAALTEQAAGLDADALMTARLALRPEKEQATVSRVQAAYGENYDPRMMADSKQDVATLLGEETETRSVRERLQQKRQPQERQKKQERHEQER